MGEISNRARAHAHTLRKQDKHTEVCVRAHKQKKISHRINTGRHQLLLRATKQTKIVDFRIKFSRKTDKIIHILAFIAQEP